MAKPTNHTYSSRISFGITLHMIETSASNIVLKNLAKSSSLSGSGNYGLNGGWFNLLPVTDKNPLNITIDRGGGGCGIAQVGNHGNGLGAISWINNNLNYHWGVANANQISNNSAATWIQGGFPMRLGNKNWYNLCKDEIGWEPDYMKSDSQSARAAMVIRKSTKKVYLIMTKNAVSWSVFRTAIMSAFNLQDSGENTDYQGIFLDGSGSAQLRAKSSTTTTVSFGGTRALCGIVALRNVN